MKMNREESEEEYKKTLIDDMNKRVEENKKRAEAYNKKMKMKGYTHKTTFCIHPISGGDDYMESVYSDGELTATEIKKITKKSAVEDYRTDKL